MTVVATSFTKRWVIADGTGTKVYIYGGFYVLQRLAYADGEEIEFSTYRKKEHGQGQLDAVRKYTDPNAKLVQLNIALTMIT